MGTAQKSQLRIWLTRVAVLYAGLLLAVWAMQERLIFAGAYFGSDGIMRVPEGVEVVRLPHPSGGSFRVAAIGGGSRADGTVLVFVGNGENLRQAVAEAQGWARYGQNVLAMEYPGYGQSDGSPSYDSVLRAAELAADFAEERFGRLSTTAVGTSLGSFSAVHLASLGRVERIVLRAPPLSVAEVGAWRYPFIPVGLLLRHRFDNAALASRVLVPALVLHGDRDESVPLSHGQRLAAMLGGPTRLEIAEGRGHNDLPVSRDGPYGSVIAGFLAGK
jgi:pimeloyl-ACP methyl ester carboxylesterase